MSKRDLKTELKSLYSPSAKEVVVVNVPAMNFLMIDGRGDPNTSQEYRDAIEALFGLSYTLKFMIKKGKPPIEYGVMPLEGLWWAEDVASFMEGRKDLWLWTAMIMQPEFITKAHVKTATDQLGEKKNPAALSRVRFERFKEGKSAQILHIGPYAAEAPTIKRIHDFIAENGWQLSGKHHEIYLGDPRRTAPEKLKTVIRQPFKKG